MSDKQTADPRATALALLNGVSEDGRLLSELAPRLAPLAPADRARAQRLATATLRARDRIDRMLRPFLRRVPPGPVMNALRLGTLELVEGAPAHGVVNAYVALVRADPRHGKLGGLVNAVLRQADGITDTWGKRPVPMLPAWLRKPLIAAWGNSVVAGMEKAHFAGAPLDLTAKGDPVAVAEATGGMLLPTGSVRLAEAGQVSALPGFAEGAWWVQDAAAAMPVRLLGDVAGLSALDLCAAPGGKTLQLAAAGASVTAVDLSEARMARVAENLSRTGLAAETRVDDAFAVTGQWDIVVLDAPCSATGTIRRHPDLPWAKDGSDFGALIEQQARMIDHALGLVVPGGRLLYCTCSLLPDEGEVQVEEALGRHAGLAVDSAALDRPGVVPGWISAEGGLRLRPDLWPAQGGMDGFYMAVLRKPA